jgi:uncharacterized membrane protein YeiB
MKKKVFSSWLMDIAKYIVTALILSTALSDKEYGLYYYLSCLVVVAIIVFVGLSLLNEPKKEKKKKKSNN